VRVLYKKVTACKTLSSGLAVLFAKPEDKVLQAVTFLYKTRTDGIRINEFAKYAQKVKFVNEWNSRSKEKYITAFQNLAKMGML
jgi:hypothetical protein